MARSVGRQALERLEPLGWLRRRWSGVWQDTWRAALALGVVLLGWWSFVPPAQAATPATPASPASPSTPAAAKPDAAVLYHNYCSVCHGDKGDGRSRAAGSLSTMPRDFTSAASRRELDRDRIAAAIAVGKPGTAMVSWKTQLSAADITQLADYVYTRFVAGSATAAPFAAAPISGTRAHGGREADAVSSTASTVARVDMTVGLPNGLKGDIQRGGAFYLANCATCHGARGDGAGPRAYFINPKPRSFIEASSRARFNRIALYAAVSEGRLGSEMPAWNKVATPQQMADVAEYVFQTFIVAPPTAQAPQAVQPNRAGAGAAAAR